MTEERFEEFLKNALDEMDPVPVPPREAMWAQIDQARRFARNAERKTSRRVVWMKWAVGTAAVLVVGIGIGRMTALQQANAPTQPHVAGLAQIGALGGPDTLYLDGPNAMSGFMLLWHRAMSIAGGTSEIKRNQIGERILGLPRDPLIS